MSVLTSSPQVTQCLGRRQENSEGSFCPSLGTPGAFDSPLALLFFPGK